MKITRTLSVTALVVTCGAAMADPTIDGTVDGSYGAAIAVQDTATGFGDSNLGQIDYANGSELDGMFAYVGGGNLYLTLTGNLESNFNKLDIFIDSASGGQNTLRGDNPNVDFNGLNRMAGLTFDTGFAADYWLSTTGGGGPYGYYVNYAELLTSGGGTGGYVGSNNGQSGGALSGGTNPGILAAINNSNVAGVTSASAAGAGSVTTGMEFAISLAAIGSPVGEIRISAFINGGGHDFVSNQVLGGAGGAGNLGDPANLNFNNVSGLQYAAVPEPGTFAALGLGAVALLRRRRK